MFLALLHPEETLKQGTQSHRLSFETEGLNKGSLVLTMLDHVWLSLIDTNFYAWFWELKARSVIIHTKI